MRALRLMSWKSEPVLIEVPKPRPGPGQVVVKIGGAGACHSDLHLMHDFDAGMLPWTPPFTLGHENAGWVEAIGAGVNSVSEGDAVAVYGAWGCGKCAHCLIGIETLCEDLMAAPVPGGGGGLGLDGGMAEYLLVPNERHLLPLPPGIEPFEAAPLTDAGLTPYHAVRRSWPKLTPGANAVVIGIGGLGHLGVQIVKATTGASVIAVDLRPESLDMAAKMGADHTVQSGATSAEQIRELTGGKGADVVLDFVGSDATLALSAAIARPLGDITLVGIAGGTLDFSFFSVPYEVSVQTIYWGSRPELEEVLLLGARGLLTPTITKYSLDHAAIAYKDLRAGKVSGRAVIVP